MYIYTYTYDNTYTYIYIWYLDVYLLWIPVLIIVNQQWYLPTAASQAFDPVAWLNHRPEPQSPRGHGEDPGGKCEDLRQTWTKYIKLYQDTIHTYVYIYICLSVFIWVYMNWLWFIQELYRVIRISTIGHTMETYCMMMYSWLMA